MKNYWKFSNVVLCNLTIIMMMLAITLVAQAQSYKQCKVQGKNFRCVKNISYGSHALQKIDLYLPNNVQAGVKIPLVIYIHGGGYYMEQVNRNSGIRGTMPARKYLDDGMAWATIDYRLSGEFPFRKSNSMPYPVQMADGARAIQKLRQIASSHSIDKNKLAVGGSSAGGGISAWTVMHDDLKKTNSSDPVQRESSKVRCLGLVNTQTTLNIPEVIDLLDHPDMQEPDEGLSYLYGLKLGQWARAPRYWNRVLAASYLEASPISHLDASDDFEVIMVHSSGIGGYGSGNIHGAEFGRYLSTGEPANIAKDYGRTNLKKLGIKYQFYSSLGDSQMVDQVFGFLKTCLRHRMEK